MAVQRALGDFNPAAGDTVLVSGTFSTTDWTTTSTLAASPSDTNLYTGTFANDVATGATQYHKFIINPGGNSIPARLHWESYDNRSFRVAAGNQTLPVVYFNNLTSIPATPNAVSPDFIAGADMSHLRFFEDRGIAYRVNGTTRDALAILRERGLNCVRLRLFTSSAAQAQSDPYNRINNLDYTVPLAVRVKTAGLKFLLDFHYSDTWADPSHQSIPGSWTNLGFAQLAQQMRVSNSNCIAAFKAAGAMPDYVQVGNEITGGMLWPLGAVPGTNPGLQWSQLAQLMTNAIQGIRDAAGEKMPKIMVHIDRGGDWTTTKWFFDNLIQSHQVPFDIIGVSYYPVWHGSLGALANCLTNSALRYGKPVIIAETAFPWTNSVWKADIEGFPGTTNGQVQYMAALAQLIRSVPNNLGAGIFWWGTEYQRAGGYNLAGFDTTSFFNARGDVLPVAEAFGQMAAPVLLSTRLNGSGLNVQWPLSGSGMSLTTTTSLSPNSVWLQVTNTPRNTNATFQITVPMDTNTGHFYRLQSH